MSIDADFYIQIEPEFSRVVRPDGERRVISAKAVNLTQKKPSRPRGVLVKLTVRIPEAAFQPLRPEAVVVVPEDMAVATPIEVEAVEPDE